MVGLLEPRLYFLEERDEQVLSKRILSLSRSNKVRSAFDLYMSVEVSGLQASLHACNSLLSCLLRNQLLDDALRIFDMMKEKEMTSGHTYSLILKAVANTRGSDSALKMFGELEAKGVAKNCFDAIVYNTMISICAKANNWVQAERIWRNMKENHQSGTTITYNLLVSIFVRCDQNELALDAYHEMIQDGLKPSEDIMIAVIVTCTKDGKWSLALSIFQNMLESGFNPSTTACNALINSLGKAGEVELAFKVYDLVRSLGHAPDTYTWNALLGALYSGNRYGDVLRLFESIKREQNSQLNLHLYNKALMSCRRLALWDQSLQLLWQMETSGLPVPTASYNFVIGACEVARKPKVALQVYEHMVHQNCTPDIFTYLSLIRACIWGSLWAEVEEILEHVAPDVSLYNTIIQGMCLRGKTTSARKLYMKMRERGLKPDGKTRALMLQNFTKDSVRQGNRYRFRK
ncbi:pentatricopeptide repeat-containing protein At3g29290 isoform X2 [Telopea speciosissima]|nr:pentatricopeptide repeat-containing protein At3g29290 isoform X2 [Telopea speciosissima]